MHFYKFHVGDYLSHTRHLTPMEDLAYRRMLDYAYLHERGLDGDAASVARAIGLRGHEAEVSSVLSDFWQQEGGVWVNRRVEKELAAMSDKRAKASAAGKASASIRSTDVQQTLNVRSTGVEQSSIERSTIQDSKTPRLQDTSIQEDQSVRSGGGMLFSAEVSEPRPKKPKPPGVQEVQDSADFQRFWTAYDKKVGILEAAKSWLRLAPDLDLVEKIIVAADNYRKDTPDKEYRKNPSTWLNQKGWLDERIIRGAGTPRDGGFDRSGKWQGVPRHTPLEEYSKGRAGPNGEPLFD